MVQTEPSWKATAFGFERKRMKKTELKVQEVRKEILRLFLAGFLYFGIRTSLGAKWGKTTVPMTYDSDSMGRSFTALRPDD